LVVVRTSSLVSAPGARGEENIEEEKVVVLT
jgi:hypothetical protein